LFTAIHSQHRRGALLPLTCRNQAVYRTQKTVGADAMHDRMGESRFAISSAERLLSRIDEVTREVHRAREERAADPVRTARLSLASAHRVKRLKHLETRLGDL
jgi:hypothetical protein